MPVMAGLWDNRDPSFILFEKRYMQIFTKRLFFLLMLGSAECKIITAQVIDMHMHSYTEKDFWTGKARNGFESSKTANGHLEETIKKMDFHKIKWAVVCGTIASIEKYTKADQRFIPAYQDYEDTLMPVQQFEEYILSGKIKVFGEVMAVYKGRTLNDPIYQPYLATCEKHHIPVAYHSGGSFPNAQNLGWPRYRIALGDPFLIEDVLVKYPKLKLYLMHAGENFYENTLRMMDGYPNLYADLGVEMWLHPMTKDFAVKFLRSAKEYGVLDRVMFGSDQMVWPQSITSSINFLNALEFLTKEEKEMILYKNAKTFLGIKD
jgi:predicted TIM-barrel fold metal-dependent hydrolase